MKQLGPGAQAHTDGAEHVLPGFALSVKVSPMWAERTDRSASAAAPVLAVVASIAGMRPATTPLVRNAVIIP